ncbi:MAG: DUF1178 domain-containing protein [Alphaproteobacteria bacterium]|nr:MAG: DUF1178 domain-containing protein [Alphaproteobacteria bacterium]
MIVFDLRCDRAHVFEAWFGSSDDYEGQRARGLIACPLCGNADVGKAVMAPAVGAKGNSSEADGRSALLAAQRKLEAASDYVGGAFAVTARALHDGDMLPRSIYGEATLAEARALAEDGIPVLPLPFTPLVRSDG